MMEINTGNKDLLILALIDQLQEYSENEYIRTESYSCKLTLDEIKDQARKAFMKRHFF